VDASADLRPPQVWGALPGNADAPLVYAASDILAAALLQARTAAGAADVRRLFDAAAAQVPYSRPPFTPQPC